MKWIEERPNDWTYRLVCSECGFSYSPRGYEDGTIDKPFDFCPKCGKKSDSSDN